MFDAFETEKEMKKSLTKEEREFKKVEKMIEKKDHKALGSWLKKWREKGSWW